MAKMMMLLVVAISLILPAHRCRQPAHRPASDSTPNPCFASHSRDGFGKSVTSVISPSNRLQTRMNAGIRRLQLSVIQRNPDYSGFATHCFY